MGGMRECSVLGQQPSLFCMHPNWSEMTKELSKSVNIKRQHFQRQILAHLLLLPEEDLGHRTCNFACHKRLPTTRALVVEKDTVAGVHAVRLAVVLDNPVAVQLGHACVEDA